MKHAVILVALLIGALALSHPASAKGRGAAKTIENSTNLPIVKPLLVGYAVYVGGVHLLQAEFLFHEEPPDYHVKARIETHGLWKYLMPWRADLFTDGKIDGDRLRPAVHNNSSTWGDNTKLVAMKFDDSHAVDVTFVPHEDLDKNREFVTREQSRDSLDPLSAAVQLLGNVAIRGTCEGREPAFDGKRRFDLIGRDKGPTVTDPQGYGVYKGVAHRCDLSFKMMAGRWLDREHSLFWQYMDGEKGQETFRLWLAKVSPELPEIAVRAESPSVWGRIVVHMTDWRFL